MTCAKLRSGLLHSERLGKGFTSVRGDGKDLLHLCLYRKSRQVQLQRIWTLVDFRGRVPGHKVAVLKGGKNDTCSYLVGCLLAGSLAGYA